MDDIVLSIDTPNCPVRRLPMIHQNSLRFYNDIAYDDYNGLVLDDSEGKRLAGNPVPNASCFHQLCFWCWPFSILLTGRLP